MARPIWVRPGGEPVEVSGALVVPGDPELAAALRIDLWRHVRHPPPALWHVATIKRRRAPPGRLYVAGAPEALVGKVLTWVWDLGEGPIAGDAWRVRVDVRQGRTSCVGYPVEYAGSMPQGQPVTELRISEPIESAVPARRGRPA